MEYRIHICWATQVKFFRRSAVQLNDDDYQNEFFYMLPEFRDLWDGHLGRINTLKHRIELTLSDIWPIHSATYRGGLPGRKFEGEEIEEMLRMHVIIPAQTERAAQDVVARKKDGALRFCIDYWKVNVADVRDSFPLPRMDEQIDSLGDARVVPALDANSVYCQLKYSIEIEVRRHSPCITGPTVSSICQLG